MHAQRPQRFLRSILEGNRTHLSLAKESGLESRLRLGCYSIAAPFNRVPKMSEQLSRARCDITRCKGSSVTDVWDSYFSHSFDSIMTLGPPTPKFQSRRLAKSWYVSRSRGYTARY